jgi:hypothetical protein
MKRFRLPVLVAGALVALVGVALAVVFSSTFQTWAARRAIASQPGLHASVGSVSAGMKRVELKDLRYVHAGAVLTLPQVEIDVPLIAAAWDDNVTVTRLVAKGWTLDLSQSTNAPAGAETPPTPAPPELPANGGRGPGAAVNGKTPASAPATAAAQTFAGVFTQLKLPVDLSVDGVHLEGDVILPDSRGRVEVTVVGGGRAAGGDG